MSYMKKTISGMAWIAGVRAGIRIATIVRTAILARILTPAQFGSFGIAAMSLSLMEIMTETGINSILLQEKDNFTRLINTAWVISICRGILISCIILISAPLVTDFFNSPDSLSLLYLTAAIPFIRGFINPSVIKFQKELKFSKEFIFRTSVITLETIAVILWAVRFRTPDSFVIGLIIAALAEVGFSFWFIQPRPRFDAVSTHVRYILNRGKWITGFGILDYLYTNGDNILVGRMLGNSALGIYQNAYKLSALPITEIVGVFYRVTFPVFTQLADYPARLKRAALNSVLIISGILLAAGVALYFLAEPIVMILLGPNWVPAIPAIQALAFLGFVRGTANGFNSLFMALKKQKYVTLITFCSVIGLAVSIVPLVSQFGIIGAAYSAMIGSLTALPLGLYLAYRTLNQMK